MRKRIITSLQPRLRGRRFYEINEQVIDLWFTTQHLWEKLGWPLLSPWALQELESELGREEGGE